MSTSRALGEPADGSSTASGAADPFVTHPSGPTHLRYSNFDSQLFALGPGTSAEQAKRALEAHLKETERRMEEAGKLGTALVQQQKELTDRLREVEELQSEAELNPDLRQKLISIEKDYNEVARESARAFLPKPRVPSNEGAQGSPFPPEGRGGRRSVSPSKFEKFESLATGSPTKLSVPNRKLRNQPASRVHDIEFAAEISTSLITQVRNLQAILAEREEELRDTKGENARLEIDTEAFQQRMKTLDESEQRYKDENWNLETQIHELIAAQKEAAEREKKLTQSLNLLQLEKNATQRELDEARDNLSKLDEKHTAAIKNLEIELGTSRRNAAIVEGERLTMQKKVEDLTNQNQELAKAFSVQRGRTSERESGFGMSDEDFVSAADDVTPEHSPPPSPVKGTPRHSVLESETLKNSLGHAQRTIQSLRTNYHREKTEKMELKRMLQEARDELEKARGDPSAANRRSRKVDSREFKKPLRLGQLGGARSSKTELYVDDGNWEDNGEAESPRSASAPGPSPLANSVDESADDHFDTANETSDAAFETANEHDRGTETEDFHTGAEDLTDDAEATETEASPSRGLGRFKRPSLQPLNQPGGRFSYHSTASTSEDDDDLASSEIRTPTSVATQKMRLRVSRGALNRRSRQASEEPNLQSSPASFANSSNAGTPQAAGQSLFAELGDLEGSDDDSYVGGGITPSRRSTRSLTPGSIVRRASPPPDVPALPKVIMVDSGMMTEPVDVRPALDAPWAISVEGETSTDDGSEPRHPTLALPLPKGLIHSRPSSMQSVIGPAMSRASVQWLGDQSGDGEQSRPLSTFSYSDTGAQYDPEMEAELAQFPMPPKLGLGATPILPPPQTLSLSSILCQDVEPLSEPEAPAPALGLSAIASEHIEPIEIPAPPPLSLSMPALRSEHVEPIEVPAPPPLALSMPVLRSEHVEPVEIPLPPPMAFSMATLLSEQVEPIAEPEPPVPVAPSFTVSRLVSEHIEPIAEPEPLPVVHPAFAMSNVVSEHIEPVAEPEPPVPQPPALSLPVVMFEEIRPVAEPELPAPELPTFTLPSLSWQEIEPVAAPEAPALPLALLSLAGMRSEHIEPVHDVALRPAHLSISDIISQYIDPVAEPEVPQPAPVSFALSRIASEEFEPREIPAAPLSLATILSEHVEPVAEPEPPKPAPISLSFSPISAEELEPRQEPESPPPALSLSTLATQHVEPVAEPAPPKPAPIRFTLSQLSTEEVEPRHAPAPWLSVSRILSQDVEPRREPPLPLAVSSIHAQSIEPIASLLLPPLLGFSAIRSIDSEPIMATSPKRHAFILPRDAGSEPDLDSEPPQTPTKRHVSLAKARGRNKADDVVPVIAEDETRQSLSGSPLAETPESQRPFKELSGNTPARQGRKPSVPTSDQGAQTSLTAEAIDEMFRVKAKAFDTLAHDRSDSLTGALDSTPSTVRIHRPSHSRETSYDSMQNRRPGSSASARGSIRDVPPLPSNHREVIEAARSSSSHGGSGGMGPPLFPASALRGQRPTTPNRPMSPASVTSARGTPTPRAIHGRHEGALGTAAIQSPTRSAHPSRKSSVSSFVSEIDTRFNMHTGMPFDSNGFGPNTDPRMIQAITQTMIGEYLWKYTRKAGRGEMSGNRHRRYFWVHPYTRTLYWSERDPSSGGRSEVRTKSVPIEAVRVVTDDNPMPPGLHRKSLVVIAPGRTIKFTCTTGQRHETWFNALSYLLLRTNNEGQNDAEEMVGNITSADVDEFNPSFGQRPVSGTRPRPPPSLSSYNSRTTRNESPAAVLNMEIPTLTPSSYHKASVGRASGGTLGRFSSYWKDSKFSSLRSRSTSGRDKLSVYQASEVHDSAEDLRQIIEQQDRESDRLENVRACCDGKHDVGAIGHGSKRGRHSSAHTHSHPGGPSQTSTPSGTLRSRG